MQMKEKRMAKRECELSTGNLSKFNIQTPILHVILRCGKCFDIEHTHTHTQAYTRGIFLSVRTCVYVFVSYNETIECHSFILHVILLLKYTMLYIALLFIFHYAFLYNTCVLFLSVYVCLYCAIKMEHHLNLY